MKGVEFVQAVNSRRVHVRVARYGSPLCDHRMHVTHDVDPAEVLVDDICKRCLRSCPGARHVASDGCE